MGEGSVWFRASIGSRKNAEARWLLPMICRRGGIDKSDIGAIRVMDTTTEFEISAVADKFAVKIRRPDKEDNIRIEALPDGPQAAERAPKPHGKFEGGKPHGGKSRRETTPGFDTNARYDTRKPHREKPAFAGKPRHDGGRAAKPAFGKKKKKKFRD
jgi:ATP-dependent RNA helicase DeaD